MGAIMKIADWRAVRKNSLLGFAKVELPGGMVISDVTILSGERDPWASPPSKPMINRNGAAVKDLNGKVRYSPTIEFTSKEVRDRFSNAVVEALRLAQPEALE
jgi:hypothetical protein